MNRKSTGTTRLFLQKQVMALVLATSVVVVSAAVASTEVPDSSMTLRGGEKGTVFDDMTIKGEDRIQFEFSRPELTVDLDSKNLKGLEWENTHAVIERHSLSFLSPFLDQTRHVRTPYLARPWLNRFTSGPVARFTPQVEGVERWTLTVANSQGNTVVTFSGLGKVPKEIAWDGLSSNGVPSTPGLTYSYVFEAHDRAGNKRNFMGDGFKLPPYKVRMNGGTMLLFSGKELQPVAPGRVSPILLETATWLNQGKDMTRTIKIETSARSFDQANSIAEAVINSMKPLLLGNPQRIQATTRVEPDAPEDGSVIVRMGP